MTYKSNYYYNYNMKNNQIYIESGKYDINSIRMILLNYYKNNYKTSLKVVNNTSFTYLANKEFQSNLKSDNIINYNDQEFSDEETKDNFYELKNYYDNSGQIVYYSDKKLYKDKKNIKVNDFSKCIVGFLNIGNSCYINSFLQIILHTPNFLKYLNYLFQNQSYGKDTLIYNLFYLSKYPYDPNYILEIKKIMGKIDKKYKTFIPGDSQNFAIDFLAQIINECKNNDYSGDSDESTNDKGLSKFQCFTKFCKNYHNKKNKIEKLFQFVEIRTKKSSMHNYHFSIELHIKLCFPPNCNNTIDLTTLLNNKYLKKDINNNTNQLKIAELPEILIISFIRGIEGKSLIKTKVTFNEKLELDSYLDLELIKNIKNKSYRLYGINERYGNYKSQGHYISYIKIDNKKWYMFSDHHVQDSLPDFSSRDVFGLYYVREDCMQSK